MASSKGSEWSDVTKLFKECSGSLGMNELVHQEYFSLQEAMSALELMDPKMDNISQESHSTFDHASFRVEDHAHLSVSELLVVLQKLLICEIAWLDGSSLAETIFICAFTLDKQVIRSVEIHTQLTVQDFSLEEILKKWTSGTLPIDSASTNCMVLLSLVLGTLRSCDVIRHIILLADMYEEEDFYPTMFDLNFYPEVSLRLAQSILEKAEKMLSQSAKTATEADFFDVEIILGMIRARKHMLIAFQSLAKLYRLNQFLPDEMADQEYAFDPSEPETAYRHFERALQEIKGLPAVAPLDSSAHPILEAAFLPLLHRNKLGSAPVRVVTFKELPKAISAWGGLIESFTVAMELYSCSSLSGVQALLLEYWGGRTCGPEPQGVAGRSLAWVAMAHHERMFGKYELLPWLAEDLTTHTGCPKVLLTSEAGQHYLQQCCKEVLDMLQLPLLNPGRQRYKIADALQRWAVLEDQACQLDGYFQQEYDLSESAAFFTNWAYSNTFQLMDQFIRIGIRTDIYADHEKEFVYWYWDIILYHRNHLLAQIEQRREEMQRLLGQDPDLRDVQSHRKGKKKGSKHAKNEPSKKKSRAEHLEQERLELNLYRTFCKGTLHLLLSLKKLKLAKEVNPQFTDTHTLFCHRFKAFCPLPQALTFQDFQEQVETVCNGNRPENTPVSQQQQDTLGSALECFHIGKMLIEKTLQQTVTREPDMVKRLEDLARIAISNTISINLIDQKITATKDAQKDLSVSYDYSLSNEFPVLAIS